MKNIYNFLLGLAIVVPSSLSAQTYCTPSFSSGCTFNNYISQVVVGGMTNNTSGCTVSNYTNKNISMTAGDTISMTVKTAGWDGVAVYVDLNNDGDMTDTLEMLYVKYTASSPPITYNFNITIPASTAPGNHRFRVNCGNGGSVGGGNPCVSTSYGNFHDYTMVVTNNCPGDSNLAVSNITPNSSNITWAARNGIGYEYVLDTNANPPTGSGTATTGTSYNATGLTNGQHYYFHIRTSCGGGQYSAWGTVDFVACSVPDAQINQSGSIDLCKGDTAFLSVPFDSSYKYTWYRNSSKIPGANSNKLNVFLFPAKYYVKVETFPGCVSISDKAQVIIHNNPNPPTITADGPQLTTSGYAAYQWYHNNLPVSGATDSTHRAQINGYYFVEGFDTNTCSANSDTIPVNGVGITFITLTKAYSIYPNPSNGLIKINFLLKGQCSLILHNAVGKIVYQEHNILYPFKNVDLSNVPKGIYLLTIQHEGKIYTEKILLE